jgi:hypothetical protein
VMSLTVNLNEPPVNVMACAGPKLKTARTHKSSLIGAGLTNVRYAPVATKFCTAAK